MAELAIADLSVQERATLAGLKRQIVGFSDKLSIVRTTSADLAPKVMKAFKALSAKYDALTFVGFARLLDPTVPLQSEPAKDGAHKGYLVHKTYVALDYMRRSLRQADAAKARAAAKAAGDGGRGRINPATDELARMLKTILQVVKSTDVPLIMDAVAQEFALGERAKSSLQKRIESAKPIVDLSMIRPVSIKPDNIIHVDRATFAKPEAPQAQAASARGRKRAA